MISESWESGLQKMPCVRRVLTMYYMIEETKESTNFYYVQTEKWCLSLAFWPFAVLSG